MPHTPTSPRSTRASLTPAVVQLRLLGNFELSVHRESRTAFLNYDKPRLLLAILALARGEPISRARLADMLWPDISQTQGKARIRHALHVLRQGPRGRLRGRSLLACLLAACSRRH